MRADRAGSDDRYEVIPLQIEKYLRAGSRHDRDAFRRAVNDFEGPMRIAMISAAPSPERFSGAQGKRPVDLRRDNPDRYLFSSELYGLVEAPSSSRWRASGPLVRHAGAHGTDLHPGSRCRGRGGRHPGGSSMTGRCFPSGKEAVRRAEITTRDIDRGPYPHYFLKELQNRPSPSGRPCWANTGSSGRRGKAPSSISARTSSRMESGALPRGKIRRIVVIGHGTAAVAGSAVADAENGALPQEAPGSVWRQDRLRTERLLPGGTACKEPWSSRSRSREQRRIPTAPCNRPWSGAPRSSRS